MKRDALLPVALLATGSSFFGYAVLEKPQEAQAIYRSVAEAPEANILPDAPQPFASTTITTTSGPTTEALPSTTTTTSKPAEALKAEKITTPPTTTLSQIAINECLKTGSEVNQNWNVYSTGSPECTTYANGLYQALASTALYGTKLNATGKYLNYDIRSPGRFQEASGLPFTNAFDPLTVQTMDSEVRRMADPGKLCTPDIDPQSWSREELVKRLAGMGALTNKAAFFSAPRTDLLNPALTTGGLIQETSLLTQQAACEGYGFSITMANTGHPPDSLHKLGRALDIRPFGADNKPMPAWTGRRGAGIADPLLPQHWISNNPGAKANGLKIWNFLTKSTAVSETLWTDGPSPINPNTELGDLHHDHIHFGVSSSSSSTSSTASSARTSSSANPKNP